MIENNHELVLKNASELSITGVVAVHSATAQAVIGNTTCGGIKISGKGLHVEKLDLECQILQVTGTVNEIKYVPEKKTIIKRIFK